MNDEIRKLLTNYLGECWNLSVDYQSGLVTPLCNGCMRFHGNRSFTTPADADAIRRKMNEKGDWLKFFLFAEKEYEKIHFIWQTRLSDEWVSQLFTRLMENFNELAGEWIMGGNVSN